MKRTCWSCFADSGDDGLDPRIGHGDVLDSRDGYDSDVVNHRRVSVDAVLVLRDRRLAYGFGVVESIEAHDGVKRMARCTGCDSSSIRARKNRLPRYRCDDCKRELDAPEILDKAVRRCVAHYAPWCILDQAHHASRP
jgi:hypothetical protein